VPAWFENVSSRNSPGRPRGLSSGALPSKPDGCECGARPALASDRSMVAVILSIRAVSRPAEASERRTVSVIEW
jgi:hypothetical protein